MQCQTACREWAKELLQRTATLPRRRVQWNCCNALPQRRGAVGIGPRAMHCHSASGQWKGNPCNAAPQCLEVVGCGTTAMHSHTAWGRWAVEVLQCTATLPVGGRQWNYSNKLPHCPGVAGNETPTMHCHTAHGHWAVELLQHTATLPVRSGQ